MNVKELYVDQTYSFLLSATILGFCLYLKFDVAY